MDHYCGTSSIPTVSATSRVVYLIFVSNDRISGKGFVATYKQVNGRHTNQGNLYLIDFFYTRYLFIWEFV